MCSLLDYKLNDMMQKVTLTRVFRKDQETKWGLKTKVSVKINEILQVDGKSTDDQWISCFFKPSDKSHVDWKEGDVITVSLSRNGDFLNFSMKEKTDFSNFESRLKKLEAAVFGGGEPEDVPAE